VEGGAEAQGAQPSQQPTPQTAGKRPRLTVPQLCQINEVARVLIVALLPSDAGIRFGRARYYRSSSTPQPGIAQLARI
jgi:hypothetical protein